MITIHYPFEQPDKQKAGLWLWREAWSPTAHLPYLRDTQETALYAICHLLCFHSSGGDLIESERCIDVAGRAYSAFDIVTDKLMIRHFSRYILRLRRETCIRIQST